MRSSIRTQAYAMAAVPLIFMVCVLAMGLIIEESSATAQQHEGRTQTSLHDLDVLEQRLGVAGQIAVTYKGPKDNGQMARLHAMRAELRRRFANLRSDVRGQPGMERRVTGLAAAYDDGMILLDTYLRALERHDAKTTAAIARSPKTRALNQRISNGQVGFTNAERAQELAALQSIRARFVRYESALIALTVSGILCTLIVFGWFGVQIVSRLSHLARNAEAIANNKPADPIEGADEFADLDRVYRAMMDRVTHGERITGILQRVLMPQVLPKIGGVHIDAAYLPAAVDAQVGGDWYDIFALTPRKFCVSIGDVAGHGLRAAALMATARIAVRTAARTQSDPSFILRNVNQVVCADEPERLVSAFVGIVDTIDGTLSFASAGHPPPLLLTPDGSATYLEATGHILGADVNAVYEEAQIGLGVGSALVLYTDGVVEADRDFLKGLEELREAALQQYEDYAPNIASAIAQQVLAGKQQQDDAAMVFIGMTELGKHANTSAHRTWSLDARDRTSAHRVKRALLWQLSESVGRNADLTQVELIYGELIGNVARHTPGAAEVSLDYNGGRALLCVSDRGAPFALPFDGAQDVLAEGGRGLFIVRTIARALSIEHLTSGNRIVAELPLSI